MEREYCQTCSMLEDFYRIKLNRFLLAARSSSTWSRKDLEGWDRDVVELKQEVLIAGRCWVQHSRRCPRVSDHVEAA